MPTATDTTATDSEPVTAAEAALDTPDSPADVSDEATKVVRKAVADTMNPAELEIADNVRKNFRLEDHPDYTDSIREHGVKLPIWAIRMPDGRTVVRDGQVRTLTALAFEQTEVPVWLTDFDATIDEKESEITRILDQITVNDRHIPLTEGDRAAGIALALEFGASPTRIGKALQKKRDEVKLVGKIGASATARGLIDDQQLDFEQAAIIADYDSVGDTDAVEKLLDAPRNYFTYTAKRIAADREERRAVLAAARPYAEAGFGVLTDYPDNNQLVTAASIVDADGVVIGVEQIQDQPAEWLVWCELDEQQLVVERGSGVVVERDTVDWQTDGSPDRTPRDGMRHADEVEYRDHWIFEYWLPTEQLNTRGWRQAPDTDTDTDTDTAGETVQVRESQPGDPATAEADDEAAAQARAAAETKAAEEREQTRQANRRVRELNKQGVAAKDARIEFVTRFLKRKNAPLNASKFIAEALASTSDLLGEYNALENALTLLEIQGGSWRRHELLEAIETAKPPRCLLIVLALVLGAYEKRTGKDCWRYSDRGVKHYMGFLAEVGHQLVPVELAAAGDLDYEQIDIDNPVQTVDLDEAA